MCWLEILRAEADQTSITAVAARLNYSRAAISLALSGKYPGDTKKIEAAVLAELAGQLYCPHLRETISRNACDDYAKSRMPTSDPQRLRHWHSCQGCSARKGERHA